MNVQLVLLALNAGRACGRTEAFDHLRARAALHHSQVGDARRRGALNAAADAIRDGREPARG